MDNFVDKKNIQLFLFSQNCMYICGNKPTNMKQFYATTEQAEKIKGETKLCQCDCGQSYAIILDDQTEVIICDSCHENSSNIEQYL